MTLFFNTIDAAPELCLTVALFLLSSIWLGPKRTVALTVLFPLSPLLLLRGLACSVVFLCDRFTDLLPSPFRWAAETFNPED